MDDEHLAARAAVRPIPGLVALFGGGGPSARVINLDRGGVELGRGTAGIDDERASRRHTEVTIDGDRWRVRDLGSRNGTFLDGARVDPEQARGPGGLLRIGRSLFLLAADVRPFAGGVAVTAGPIIGAALRRAWSEIERAATAGDTLLVTGETGTGKELAARAFHDAGPAARGPLGAPPAAAPPGGAAPRLLFGAKKGAYSGATADAAGYFQAADRGTLFLDELGELDPAVQGKLLRALETREVVPLGATQGTPVDVRIVAATTRDVRSAVAAGAFRRDLYFRVGRPEIELPPLRARVEEIPWLIARALGDVDPALRADALFVEACALRAWPGNVRELLAAVRRSGHAARADRRTTVEDRDLESDAGLAFETAAGGEPAPGDRPPREPTPVEIEAALRDAGGNVTGAAKQLGLHRNQLRRWLTKHAVDPRKFGDAGEGD
jgi:transcriptional regulator with PAS, ATPase and Fis domain